MMAGTLRVLYVDDEPGLLEIGKMFLEMSGNFSVVTIDSAATALDLLKSEQFDAIISDYQMPGMDGIAFLKVVRSSGNTIPFVLFTGKGREEVVIQALNEGADFYLQKGGDPTSQFAELTHKVRIAVSNKKSGEALKKSEEKYRHLIEHANETIVVAQDGMLKLVNHQTTEMTGYSVQELLSMPFTEVIHPDDQAMVMERFQVRMKGGELPTRYAFRVTPKNGDIRWVEISAVVIDWDGHPATLNFLTDITERKAAENALKLAYEGLEGRVTQRTADLNATNLQLQQEIETRKQIESALQESEEVFRTLIEKAPEAILLFDVNLERYIDANAKAEELFGCSRQELLDSGPQQFYLPDQPDGLPVHESVTEHRKHVSSGEELIFERRIRNARGEDRILEVRLIQMRTSNKTVNRSSYIDITGRKQMEAALRESEEKFRDFFNNATDAITIHDMQGGIIEANDVICRTLGYSREELLGVSPVDIVAPEYGATVQERARQIEESGFAVFETVQRARDGTGIPTEVIARVITYNGRPAVIATGRDITKRKRAEDALRESKERLDLTFRATEEGIWDWNLVTDEIFYSTRWKTMLGYEESEIEPHVSAWKRLMHPDDLPRAMQVVKEVLDGKRDYVMEFRMRHKDGHYVDILSRGFPARNEPEGPIIRIVGTHFDLSERKRAEKAQRESEEKYRILSEAAKDIIFIVTRTGTITYVNPAMVTFFGISPKDVVGSNINQVFPPPVAELQNMYIQQVITTRQPVTVEMVIPVPNGQVWFNTQLVPIFNSDNDLEQVLGIARDITEHKRAEEALRKSEECYREIVEKDYHSILENIQDVFYRSDANGNLILMSPSGAKMFGYAGTEEMVGKPITDFYLDPSQRDPVLAVLKTDQLVSNMEVTLKRKDGSPVHAAISSHLYFDVDGHYAGVEGILRDITVQKQAEEETRAAIERYKAFVAVSNTGEWEYHADTGESWCSSEYFAMIGRDPSQYNQAETTTLNATWIDFLHPDDRERAKRQFAEYLGTGSVGIYENHFRIKHADGHWVWIRSRGRTLRDKNGNLTSKTIGTHIDVTEYKQAEEALRESEEKYRLLADNSTDVIWTLGLDGSFTYVSPSIFQLRGYTPEEVMHQSLDEVVSRGSLAIVQEAIQKTLDEAKSGIVSPPGVIEVEQPRKDGSSVWTEVVSKLLYDGSGNPAGFIGVSRNITERKRMEEALKKSESRVTAALEHMPVGIIAADSETGRFIFSNETFQRMLGYSRDEIQNFTLADIHPAEDLPNVTAEFEKMIQGESWYATGIPVRRNDGSLFFADIQTTDVELDGRPSLLAVFTDVNERKRSDTQ
ncbi:MAG: PAS domain S-box protein [Methanomicrobiales archaeon]